MSRRYILLTTAKFDTESLHAAVHQISDGESSPVVVWGLTDIPGDEDADTSTASPIVAHGVPENDLFTVASRLSLRATVTIFERCDLSAVQAWIAQKVGIDDARYSGPCAPARRGSAL